MSPQRDPEPILFATYGTALGIFGRSAVDGVIGATEFAAHYPELAIRIRSDVARADYDTILPADIMLKIAERPDCTHDFWEDTTDTTLTEFPTSADPVGTKKYGKWTKLDRIEALKIYGAFGLFQAVDGPEGHRRQHDYRMDWLKDK